jgi:hypothetical protein
VPPVPETVIVTARLCAVVTLPTAGATITVGVNKGEVTVTAAVPDALLNVAVLAASGVYFAVRVSAPAVNDPEGMVIVAVPAASVVEGDVYPPLLRTTVPVGVPPAPVTVIVTARLCAVVMLFDAGETVTVGVVGF